MSKWPGCPVNFKWAYRSKALPVASTLSITPEVHHWPKGYIHTLADMLLPHGKATRTDE